MLNLSRIETDHPHECFVCQQQLVGGQHALYATHTAYDRQQYELDERIQRPLTVTGVELLEQ